VGRGCLGRPWLFRDLADAFGGRQPQPAPDFGEVAGIMLDHARDLVEWFDERSAMRSFRKHAAWYTKGFRGSARLRDRLMRISTLADLERILADIDRDEPYPPSALRARRGKRSGTQRVALPPGFLDDPDDATPPGVEAEDPVSGG
jgi:hypothetical protein